MSTRPETEIARLARAGLVDPARALAFLTEAGVELTAVIDLLAGAADPDLAARSLGELARVADISVPGPRLVRLLGASAALGEHLVRCPDALAWVEQDPGDAIARIGTASGDLHERMVQVRLRYRDALVSIAARDLAGEQGFGQTSAHLADAATSVLSAALSAAQAEHVEAAARVRLAVLALGKTGGRELNYISDVDVVFVGEPCEGVSEEDAMRAGAALAATVMRFCAEPTAQGAIWEVDAGLRPEGKDGPLVRTVASHLAYYQRWARTWEFQALLKARYAAGDEQIAQAYLDALTPLIWSASGREDFVLDVQNMRKRVEEHIPQREAARQIKLGVGGLRDVEFAVQLLQLVHGKADPQLRTPNTLDALQRLRDGGYVGVEDAEQLASAYAWLRSVEHRIQLHRLRRTHLMPEQEADVRRLARSLGFASIEDFLGQWRETAALIRRLHEKIFYRPLLLAVARLGADELRLSPEAARARLQALGYVDPHGAMHHLEALTAGVSRRASIQRALLPAMLGWFADGPDPDAGLLGFRQLSDALGETPWYLRTLRDSGAAAQRLAAVLTSSRYATELLLRAPEAAALLESDEDLRPRGRDALMREVSAVIARHPDSVAAIEAVRAVRRRELFRTSVADVLGQIDEVQVGRALTDVALATLHGALEAATAHLRRERGVVTATMAIIAMGRLGGEEMGYPSDADVLFVFEPLAGVDPHEATECATAIAAEVRRLCALPSPEPPLLVDADLRPEGRDGALVRTLESYTAYYRQWGEGWERQALLRAAPGVGDEALIMTFMTMIDAHRFGAHLGESEVRDLRRIKARVESERLPRGADPARHVKLGPGGLGDVEWLAQLLQLQAAGEATGLRTTSTLAVLAEAERLGQLGPADRQALEQSWRLATRIRNAVMLVRGRPGDELPRDPRDLRAVARVLGFASGGELVDRWAATSRRARICFDRLFYGQ